MRLEDGRFVLKDRGSRCGTFVNDEQVTERPLRHRDKIRLGRSGSLWGGRFRSCLVDAEGYNKVEGITRLADAIQAVQPTFDSRAFVQDQLGTLQSALQVFHRARPDDHRRHGRRSRCTR